MGGRGVMGGPFARLDAQGDDVQEVDDVLGGGVGGDDGREGADDGGDEGECAQGCGMAEGGGAEVVAAAATGEERKKRVGGRERGIVFVGVAYADGETAATVWGGWVKTDGACCIWECNTHPQLQKHQKKEKKRHTDQAPMLSVDRHPAPFDYAILRSKSVQHREWLIS